MMTNTAALVALSSLSQAACRSEKRGNALRFRFRRSAVETLAGVQELVDLGVKVKLYTGAQIHTAVNGKWTQRASSKTRGHMVVEVSL